MQDLSLPQDCSQILASGTGNCWAEIDLDAIRHNARLLESDGTPIMAVLKADAYGHGMSIVAPELARSGIKHFGVATPLEGSALREIIGGEASISVMTPAVPGDAAVLVRERLIPFVSSWAMLDALDSAARDMGCVAELDLEVDTGIGRAGFEPTELGEALRLALAKRNIQVHGICTHFTWGENVEDARSQWASFEAVLAEHVPSGLRDTLVIHAANSPGFLSVPASRQCLFRPGLLLYGIAPEGSEPARIPGRPDLKAALSLRAKVLLVRDLPAGTPISYGRTYVLPRAARIATIGIGYGDGYPRRFSNLGQALLPDGTRVPVRGRVCMDQTCVELPPGSSVSAGDVVTLIGESGENWLRAAETAEWIDATPHEMTTCLTSRVPRVPVRCR